MPDSKKLPSHKAFAVEKYTKDGEDKATWTEIGAAWAHKDGKGFDLNIKLVPLSGRVVLRENTTEN